MHSWINKKWGSTRHPWFWITNHLDFYFSVVESWAMVSILKPKSNLKDTLIPWSSNSIVPSFKGFKNTKKNSPSLPGKCTLTQKMSWQKSGNKTTLVKFIIDSPLHQESMMFECLWDLSAHSSVGKADCSSWSWNPAGIPIKKWLKSLIKQKEVEHGTSCVIMVGRQPQVFIGGWGRESKETC